MSRDAVGRLRYTPAVRSLRPWSTLVIVLIAVATGIEALRVVDEVFDLWLPGVGDSGRFTSLVGLAQRITLATLWCLWQHAAATNLARRAPSAQRFSASRGVWAWFIPFLNLVRPAYVILDLWRGSEALVPSDGPRRPASSAGIVTVAVWWVAHLAPLVLLPVMVATRWVPGPSQPGLALMLQAPGVLHAVLACVIVHRITRMQDAWPPGDADADPA